MYHNKKYGITFNKEAKRKAVHMAKPQICAPHLARGVLETEAPEQKVKQMIRTGSLSSVLSVYCVHACTSVCVCVLDGGRGGKCVWRGGVGVKSFKVKKKKNLAPINSQYFPPVETTVFIPSGNIHSPSRRQASCLLCAITLWTLL